MVTQIVLDVLKPISVPDQVVNGIFFLHCFTEFTYPTFLLSSNVPLERLIAIAVYKVVY